MAESSSASSPLRPVTVDGGDDDLALMNSQVLTREEVIRRRFRRVKQLGQCYRAHYWALMEELKSKYRDYYWTYGKSPFNYHNQNGVVLGGGDDIVRCRFSGCKTRAMALTNYCHLHILSDSKQKLYQGCRTVAKNLASGPSFCNKPVLISVVPPACPNHHSSGEKCLARALRRAGSGNTFPTKCKPLKFNVIASEFVHQIQKNRMLPLKETTPKVETE
ncbi:hypothetical protein Fmac_016314 [Flemingia macrophylla]|uniref:KANL2-like probable zinc-finger domain-containing protein n=1 Tax=Flemingia macrophylla TaxID=520843 RepID=A0ABD1MH87_9FABA